MLTEERVAFICYRKADSGPLAQSLHDQLGAKLRRDQLFLASATIECGKKWPSEIEDALAAAVVMVVLIGHNWFRVQNTYGQRCLDQPDDWVVREIHVALERQIPIIPVLLDGADRPMEEALPLEIKELSKYQPHYLHTIRRGTSQKIEEGDVEILRRALEMRLSPIKGLHSYEASDRAIFKRLQRERELGECLKILTKSEVRVGVLYGRAGCGKTSFLQAGVMPALDGLKTNSPIGIHMRFTREDPFRTLRDALQAQLQLSTNDLGERDLPSWFNQVVGVTHSPIVLLFDQFEEFLHGKRDVCDKFIDGLKHWYEHQSALPLKILFSTHSIDLLGEFFKQMGCNNPWQFVLRHFTSEQAVASLKALADADRMAFDEPFVRTTVLRDILGPEADGILPLELQIVALAIHRQDGNKLGFTEDGYNAIGGLKGSLDRLLFTGLGHLPEEEQETLLWILDSLVVRNTRRRRPLTADEVSNMLPMKMSKDKIEWKLKWLTEERLVWGKDEKNETDGNVVRRYELAHWHLIEPVIRKVDTQFSDVKTANDLLDSLVQYYRTKHRLRSLKVKDYWLIRKVLLKNKIRGGAEEPKKTIIKKSQQSAIAMISSCVVLMVLMVWLGYRHVPESAETKIRQSVENALLNSHPDDPSNLLTVETLARGIAALGNWEKWKEKEKEYPGTKADLGRSVLSLLAAKQKSWEHAKQFAAKIKSPELKAITFIHLAEELKESAKTALQVEFVEEALHAVDNMHENESPEKVRVLNDLRRRIPNYALVGKVSATWHEQTQQALNLIEKRIKELSLPEESLARDWSLREQVRLHALAALVASYGNEPQAIRVKLKSAKAILETIKHDQYKSIAFHVLIQEMAKCVLGDMNAGDFNFYKTYLEELIQLLPKSTDLTRHTSPIESILGRIEASAVILRATPHPSPEAARLAGNFLDEAAALISSLQPNIEGEKQNSKRNFAPPASFLLREIRALKLVYAELLSEVIMGDGERQKESSAEIIREIQKNVISEIPKKESLGPEPLDLVLTQLAVAKAYAKVGIQKDVKNALDKAHQLAEKLDNPHQKSAILRAIVEIAVGVDTVTRTNNASAAPDKGLMELADEVRKDERLDASDQGWADAAYAVALARQASGARSTGIGSIGQGLDGGLRMPSILWKWLGECANPAELSERITVAVQAGPTRNFALHGVARELARAQYLDCADKQLKNVTDVNLRTSGYAALLLGDYVDRLASPKVSVLAVSDQVKLPSQENEDAMQLVPGGYFIMGTADRDIDQKPPHYVYLDTFYIDKYEVTVGQYAKFLGKYDKSRPHEWGEKSLVNDYRMKPVVAVTHENASRYCEWAGKRLPTEAEWEKAARGTYFRLGGQDIFPWGHELPDKDAEKTGMDRSHYKKQKNWNGYKDLKDVGEIAWTEEGAINRGNKKSGQNNPGNSPYEISDMAGSVWEWVEDWYGASFYIHSPPENPKGPLTGTWKVLRGGAWDDGKEKLEATYRLYKDPPYFYYTIGFRCAR